MLVNRKCHYVYRWASDVIPTSTVVWSWWSARERFCSQRTVTSHTSV